MEVAEEDPKVDTFSLQDAPQGPSRKAKEKRRWRASLDPKLSQGPYACEKTSKNAAFGDLQLFGTSAAKKGIVSDGDTEESDDELEEEGEGEDASEDDDWEGAGEDDMDGDLDADSGDDVKDAEADAEALMDDIFAEMDEDDEAGGDEEESYEDFMAKQEEKVKARAQGRIAKKEQRVADDEVLEELSRSAKDHQKQVTKMKADVEAQRTKGLHTKNQVTLHSDLVNVRIRLQNPLTACNQMPSGPDRALFITHSQSNPESSAMEALMAESCGLTADLLTDLFDLHDAAVEGSPGYFTSNRRAARQKKRKREDAGAVVDSKEQWADVTAYWDITKPFINEAIEAWSHKAKAMDGSTAKKFKALDMSCLDQIQHTLRDLDGLTARTQVNRLRVSQFGQPKLAPKGAEAVIDENMYDDNDLYGVLLNQIISDSLNAETSAPTLAMHVKEQDELQHRQKQIIKNVEKRGTKGRKVRFDTHDKLINFKAPKPITLPDYAESLFRSLFGNAVSTQPVTAVA